MKHIRILGLLLIVLTISLTGCMDVKDISEEKADLVAEYAAGVLLRYSDEYEYRLITKDQLKAEGATNTAVPTQTSVAAPTAGSATAGRESGQQPETTQVPEVSLDELYQLDGIQVSYESCEFTKRYKNTEVYAEKGNTLFVVTFALKNISGAAKKVDLMGRKNIQYTLDVDGNQYFPGINILSDDTIDYLKTTIKKGKTKKAVLIFQMDQARASASSANLTIEEGNKKTSIKIK